MDPHEFAVNCERRVAFMKWSEASGTITYYSPHSTKKEFANTHKHAQFYTKTVFLPDTDRAVTGTEGGDILVWEVSKIKTGIGQPGDRKLEKVVILNNDNFNKSEFVSINILLTVDKYLVCGNQDGTIRFYDFSFKAAAWFEDQDLSAIKSISFSRKKPTRADGRDENDLDFADGRGEISSDFACSDFLVADSNGVIAELKSTMYEAIEKNAKKSKTIWYGVKSPVSAIAVHPHLSIIAVATDDGFIGIYDYLNNFDRKSLVHISTEDKKDERGAISTERPKPKPHMTPEERAAEREKQIKNRVITCMEFTPTEGELLVGLVTGEIKIIDGEDFQLVEQSNPLKVSEEQRDKDQNTNTIKQLIVTQDGKYFATSDIKNCVSIFKKGHLNDEENSEIIWQFSGKIMSHTREITSICFGQSLDENDTMQHRLFSVGKDRRLFEYNVANAKIDTKLPVERYFDIELESFPTSCIWYPADDSKEGLILTANDEYKMKLWNPTTQNSRRTCLGPTYGGEITKLKLLDQGENGDKYLLYQTASKVIGLIKLPLDGNPHKTMGLIAHPDEVRDVCVSADGKYVFTCGGDDLAVNMWKVDVSPINQAIALGGEGIEPFVRLIEGGREGQTFQDMNDFFYYSMIRSKKENTTKKRNMGLRVPVDQLPNLMRAMGYYPTN